MPRSLTLEDHYTTEELFRRYRRAKDPLERSHWQVVWLKSQGCSTAAISHAVGYSVPWVRELICRYNDTGARGLVDRRRTHPGAKPMLTPEQQEELARVLEEGSAPDGGPWSGPKVARWIEKKTGRAKVHDQRGWDYLLRLGFTAKTPRPHHREASFEEQEAFKK